MLVQPFDIFDAVFHWRDCLDMRPWLIVDLRPNQIFGCFPISSQCYRESCFFLDISDTDFPATGLKKSCFIHDGHLYDIPISNLKKKRGQLSGELLKMFREFSGV